MINFFIIISLLIFNVKGRAERSNSSKYILRAAALESCYSAESRIQIKEKLVELNIIDN